MSRFLPHGGSFTFILAGLLGLFLGLASVGPANGRVPGSEHETTVIVELQRSPLVSVARTAQEMLRHSRRTGLDTGVPEVQQHLSVLDEEHRRFRAALARTLPGATVHREFKVTFNGLAVSAPASRVSDLRRVPGVKNVYPSRQYGPALDTSVPLISASVLWGALGGDSQAGLGMKIAILDTGIDQTHPFLTDDSLPTPDDYPPPKGVGDRAFVTGKVIVAKLYAPPGLAPELGATLAISNSHGTHVAGIAAGIPHFNTGPSYGSRIISGVAPRAYLMNYKVLLGTGGIGETPEILQAIEDAVLDGADVVNMSLGGPPEPLADDPLVTAIRNGTELRVTFVVAAGNDGSGPQTILSPGTSPEAITVGMSDDVDHLDPRSSRGPNLDLSIKPDVTAPGIWILSSVAGGSFSEYWLGTSMAAPHVAGAAALLKQLHPTWTPTQIKSALVNTAKTPVYDSLSTEATVMERGGGRIDLAMAMDPGLTVDPPSHSFGQVNVAPNGRTVSKNFSATNVSTNGGTWTISVTQTISAPGLNVYPSTASISLSPGGKANFSLILSGAGSVPPGDYEGYVALQKEARVSRIPYFARIVYLPYATHFPLVLKNGQLP